jgi:hypothetical protein
MIIAESLTKTHGPKPAVDGLQRTGAGPVDGLRSDAGVGGGPAGDGGGAAAPPRRLTEHEGGRRAHLTRFTGRMAKAPITAQSPATVYSTL